VFFHDYDVKEINLGAITASKDTVARKSKTARHILFNLRAFMAWLHSRGTIEVLPAFPKMKKTNDSRRTHALPPEHRDIYKFMMRTGLRHGEIVAVLVESVDLKNRAVWVERRRSGAKYREGTKNETILPIPLNDTALEIATRNTRGKFPKDFLFINPATRRPYTQWFISNLWKRLSETDIPSYEATRHSFCSNLPKHTDPQIAQRLMRHKDPRSTMRYYHERAEHLLEVVQEMDNVIPLKKGNEKETD